LPPNQIANIRIAFDDENSFRGGCHDFLKLRSYLAQWIF
jgi:hypothetical protein